MTSSPHNRIAFRPKKSLGQHFLRDENIARKIIGCLNPEIPLVIEIGPGKGVLSKYLLEDPAFNPWFIEIDRESAVYLKENYPAISPRLIQADFLQFDLRGFLTGLETQPIHPHPTATPLPVWGGDRGGAEEGAGGGVTILGNFPYNISSRILFRILEHRDLVREVTGMFQNEVARRIASPPGSKEYGILSVLVQAFYRVRILFSVGESVFNPPPKVKSAVIRLVRNERERLDCDEQFWIRIVKTAFNQRRKTLRNSLRKLDTGSFHGWDDPLFDLRPERLTVDDFIELTRRLQSGQGKQDR